MDVSSNLIRNGWKNHYWYYPPDNYYDGLINECGDEFPTGNKIHVYKFEKYRYVIMKSIFKRDTNCRRCGKKLEFIEPDPPMRYDSIIDEGVVHHVISRKKGGSDHPMNLILLCTDCHVEVHRSRNFPVDIGRFVNDGMGIKPEYPKYFCDPMKLIKKLELENRSLRVQLHKYMMIKRKYIKLEKKLQIFYSKYIYKIIKYRYRIDALNNKIKKIDG